MLVIHLGDWSVSTTPALSGLLWVSSENHICDFVCYSPFVVIWEGAFGNLVISLWFGHWFSRCVDLCCLILLPCAECVRMWQDLETLRGDEWWLHKTGQKDIMVSQHLDRSNLGSLHGRIWFCGKKSQICLKQVSNCKGGEEEESSETIFSLTSATSLFSFQMDSFWFPFGYPFGPFLVPFPSFTSPLRASLFQDDPFPFDRPFFPSFWKHFPQKPLDIPFPFWLSFCFPPRWNSNPSFYKSDTD